MHHKIIHIEHKNSDVNSGKIDRRLLLKGLFSLCVLGGLIVKTKQGCDSRKKLDELKSGDPPKFYKNDVLLTDKDLIEYKSGAYELYYIPFIHATEEQYQEMIDEVIRAVKMIRNQNKKPIYIYEFALETINQGPKMNYFGENLYTDKGMYLQQKKWLEEKTVQFNLIFKDYLKTGSFDSSSLSKDPRQNAAIKKFIKSFYKLRRLDLDIQPEKVPIESALIARTSDFISRTTIPTMLANREANIAEHIKRFSKSINFAYKMRNAQVLELGYELSKKGYVPIISMGSGHDLRGTPGAKRIDFLDKNGAKIALDGELFDKYNVLVTTIKRAMITSDSYAVKELIKEGRLPTLNSMLLENMTDKKIEKLLKYMENVRDGDVFNIQLLKWVFYELDPKNKTGLWKYRPSFIKSPE